MNSATLESQFVGAPQIAAATKEQRILDVSWNNYDDTVERLATMILKSGWEFDQILCIARGGLLVGLRLSHLLNKGLAVVYASSYAGENEMERGELNISKQIAMKTDKLGKRVLLLDDLADSGVTMSEVKQRIIEDHKEVEQIRTAVLWTKTASKFIPDYSVDTVDRDTWIFQPFEKPLKMPLRS